MKPRLDMFVFADALGWEQVQKRDYLKSLLPNRNRCETLFGYSSTCDPTILTGCLPYEHGHFSFFVKAQSESPFEDFKALAWLPDRIAAHHRVRNRISRWYAQKLNYTGYFQLYSVPFSKLPYLDYTEKQDIYEKGGIIGGQPTIFESWEDSAKVWCRSDWRLGDTANIDHARSEIEAGKVELLYLFTAHLDAVMHRYGTNDPAVDAAFDDFAKKLTMLADIASRHYKEVRIHLFSDHGMSDVSSKSDMMLRWNRQPWRYGRDYTAVWDSTMARFWFHNDRTRIEALQWLTQQPDGQLLTDEQLEAWGCLFPDRLYGEYFYLLPAGSLFVPSFLNQRHVPGMHGYDPSHPDCAACWLTNCETLPVRSLPDIFSVMKESCA
ncbi:alkaline phosphatase family protein [Rubellicoccus peritrichatus]|uniref:Alkaline phosphatase family protein n=1 Tax=Rubellicoccus peritrichatus TaxID=3080537 RepID=A0AAQ3QS46_9BACT|nr:alkaline phosphatase family protein [Puniceicoccus sp. CR14]WOO42008.1 alkaline phosphatase family protein [Puniceicoccus sp. CR14]